MNPKVEFVDFDSSRAAHLTQALEPLGLSIHFLPVTDLLDHAQLSEGDFEVILMACAVAATPEGLEFAEWTSTALGVPTVLLADTGPSGFPASLAQFPMAGLAREDDAEVLAANLRSAIRTGRKLAQSTRELATHKSVLDTLPDLLFVVDFDGYYLDFHSRQHHLLVVPPADFLGKRIEDVVPPDVAEIEMSSLREAQKRGLAFGRRFKLDLPDGQHWFEVSSSAVDGNFDVPRFVLLVHEVTETVKMEESLRQQQSLIETVLWTLDDGIYIKDKEGNFLVANPGAAAALGASSIGELIGRNQAELVTGAPLEAMVASDKTVLTEGKPVEYEQPFQFGGKSSLWRARKYPWRDSAGAVIGTIGISTDITKQKGLEEAIVSQNEKLEHENSMKDKLFTILAHDLRGPVGNLSVLLGLINEQPIQDADVKEILLEGELTARRTYSLLDSLLEWIRAHIEGIDALRARIAVGDSLRGVRDWLEPQARAKGLVLAVECPDSLSVFTDERNFATIVRNLVSNAIKYSPSGSTITMSGRAEPGRILVSVADQGVGIEPETLAKLFGTDKIHSTAGTNQEKGTGLGLMFSADLSRVIGGELKAESMVGKGSCFSLDLPDILDDEL